MDNYTSLFAGFGRSEQSLLPSSGLLILLALPVFLFLSIFLNVIWQLVCQFHNYHYAAALGLKLCTVAGSWPLPAPCCFPLGPLHWISYQLWKRPSEIPV